MSTQLAAVNLQCRSQAQRYWHEQNVGRLSFRSDALAASVGCTAAELDAREARVHPDTPPPLVHPTSFTHHPRPPSSRRHLAQISPLACDVVFDALSRSQSGITDKLGCDERRASYETAQGGFDADAFEEDLARGRANVAKSYAIYPVTRLQPPTAAPRLQPPTAHCAPLLGFDQPGVALRLLRVRAAARLPRHDRLPLQLCAALPGELVGLVVTSVWGRREIGFPCTSMYHAVSHRSRAGRGGAHHSSRLMRRFELSLSLCARALQVPRKARV